MQIGDRVYAKLHQNLIFTFDPSGLLSQVLWWGAEIKTQNWKVLKGVYFMKKLKHQKIKPLGYPYWEVFFATVPKESRYCKKILRN